MYFALWLFCCSKWCVFGLDNDTIVRRHSRDDSSDNEDDDDDDRSEHSLQGDNGIGGQQDDCPPLEETFLPQRAYGNHANHAPAFHPLAPHYDSLELNNLDIADNIDPLLGPVGHPNGAQLHNRSVNDENISPRSHNTSGGSKRKTGKKKRKDTTVQSIPARPDDQANKFRRVQENRQASRGKVFPGPDNMPRKSKTSQRASLNASQDGDNDPRQSEEESDSEAEETAVVARKKPAKVPKKQPIFNGKLIGIPKDRNDLRKKLIHYIAHAEYLRGRNVELESSLALVTKNYEELQKKAMKANRNAAHVKKIAEVYRNCLFARCKFIQDKQDEIHWTKVTYEIIKKDENADDLPENDMDIWVNTYSECVSAEVNAYRSYLQSRIKESFRKYHEKNKKIPTMEDLKACALREVDLQTEEGNDLMDFYVTDLLCKFLCLCLLLLSILPKIYFIDNHCRFFFSTCSKHTIQLQPKW